MTAVSARSLGSALARIVGGDRVREDEGSRLAAAVDGAIPRWVVSPATPEQVSGLLGLASDAGLAVIPRGSGSALELGGPPQRVDVVLDLLGLDAVTEYSPDDLTVTVQAGVRAGALAAVLHARRQCLPLDPPGAAARTIGGIVATNATGPLRVRYGSARDLLLGTRFVQADGVVTWGGAKVVKSVTGYDVPKVMVGALGTLGVLVELTLRLHARPDFEATWLATFTHADPAQTFVARVLDSPIQPSRVEIMNGAALARCGLDPLPAAVAVSIGTVEPAVRAQGTRLERLARETGGPLLALSDGFWETAERTMAMSRIVLRVATLASRLAATLQEVGRAVAAALPGTTPVVMGSGPLGTLRVGLPELGVPEAGRLVERLRRWVTPDGGSVVIERASPEIRSAVDAWGPVDDEALALMRGLKSEFDPKRILNPGRFVGGL